MARTPSERQAARRARLKAAGAVQIQLTLSPEAHNELLELAKAEGVSLNEAVTRAILARTQSQREAARAAEARDELSPLKQKAELARAEANKAGCNPNLFAPRPTERDASGVFIVTGHTR